jgi:hypothetical protein
MAQRTVARGDLTVEGDVVLDSATIKGTLTIGNTELTEADVQALLALLPDRP